MSKLLAFSCPIEGCKHGKKIIRADISQIRRHSSEHDYWDRQHCAYIIGIIPTVSTPRGSNFLIEKIMKEGIRRGHVEMLLLE